MRSTCDLSKSNSIKIGIPNPANKPIENNTVVLVIFRFIKRILDPAVPNT